MSLYRNDDEEHADVRVVVHLASTGDGGRRNPIDSEYRASCRLPWNSATRSYNDALVIFEEGGALYPGTDRMGWLRPARPDFWSSLEQGDVVELMEGSRPIGFAVVGGPSKESRVHDRD